MDDTRESPALVLMKKFEEHGATVDYYDPFVSEIPATRKHKNLAGRKSIILNDKVLGSYDAVLICTDHDNIDYGRLVKESKLIIDSRNATKNVRVDRYKIIKA